MKRAVVSSSFRITLHQRHRRGCRRPSRYLWLPLLLLPISRHLFSAPQSAEETSRMEQKIDRIVADFRERLGIVQQVSVSIVSGNSHLASSACSSAQTQEYEISFDAGFLQSLDDGEVKAAVAHEMGHIWIFTNFPYLQTESLANQQALKLVPRSELQRIYEKMWKWRGGARGNLADLLGPPAGNEVLRGGEQLQRGSR